MARRRKFLRTIRFILEDLFVFLLEIVATAIKSLAESLLDAIIEWLKEVAKEIAKESKIIIIWCLVFTFGGIILIAEKRIPIDETHHLYLSYTGVVILLGSVVGIIVQVLKAILDTLGLLKPLTIVRDNFIEKNQLQDKKTRGTLVNELKVKKSSQKEYKKPQVGT